jgi:hypothetical protein
MGQIVLQVKRKDTTMQRHACRLIRMMRVLWPMSSLSVAMETYFLVVSKECALELSQNLNDWIKIISEGKYHD